MVIRTRMHSAWQPLFLAGPFGFRLQGLLYECTDSRAGCRPSQSRLPPPLLTSRQIGSAVYEQEEIQ